MYIALLLIAYLFGSLNCASMVCKMFGLPSPRSEGSKNPGATNVLRLGGKKAAAMTLLGDVLKGLFPVLIAHGINCSVAWVAWVALAAVLGHIFPIFYRFKGGKGVATTIGVVFALNVILGLLVAMTWLVVAWVSRYSSLSSLVAVILCPVYAFFLLGSSVLWPLSILAVLVILRHQQNIQRLLTGGESKIGRK